MKPLALILAAGVSLAVTVPTAHYDNSRDGVNSQEAALTPSNLSHLYKQGTYSLDAALFSQALYIPAVTISSVVHNVVIAATMNNTVYALDADVPGASPLWSTHISAPWSSWPSTALDVGQFYHVPIGILSTAVVDASGGFIYFVLADNTPEYVLHKMSLTTGSDSASVVISGSVSGTGCGASAGTLAFTPINESQRTPLTLVGGKVYFGFGSLGSESACYHGWMFAYDASSLTQTAILCLSPNSSQNGVWEAGGGIAADGSGNLYFATGNGTYDGVTEFSQSVIKVNSSLVIQDWFTPSNNSTTSSQDADISAGRVMLIPSTTLLTVGSKDGRIWVINTTSMGHLQGSGTAPQVFTVAESFTPGAATGIYGGLFFSSTGFFPVATFPTFAFSFSGSTYNTTAIGNTSANFSQVMMAGSSNSGSSPIVWALTVSSSAYNTQQAVTLRALNPATLAEYWNSGTTIGNYAKFAAPTVANGRIYVSTSDGTVVAFGLDPSVTTSGSVVHGGSLRVQ